MFNDSWLLNPTNGSCTEICKQGIVPTARHDHSLLIYSNSSCSSFGRVFLFGGYTSDGLEANNEHALSDLWELVIVEGPGKWCWRLLGGMSDSQDRRKWPRARANASLVAAYHLGCLILFGGYTVVLT